MVAPAINDNKLRLAHGGSASFQSKRMSYEYTSDDGIDQVRLPVYFHRLCRVLILHSIATEPPHYPFTRMTFNFLWLRYYNNHVRQSQEGQERIEWSRGQRGRKTWTRRRRSRKQLETREKDTVMRCSKKTDGMSIVSYL